MKTDKRQAVAPEPPTTPKWPVLRVLDHGAVLYRFEIVGTIADTGHEMTVFARSLAPNEAAWEHLDRDQAIAAVIQAPDYRPIRMVG